MNDVKDNTFIALLFFLVKNGKKKEKDEILMRKMLFSKYLKTRAKFILTSFTPLDCSSLIIFKLAILNKNYLVLTF